MEIIIASVNDRDMLVAEIWKGDQMIAEINQENESMEIEMFPSEILVLDYEVFLGVLQEAKDKLTN